MRHIMMRRDSFFRSAGETGVRTLRPLLNDIGESDNSDAPRRSVAARTQLTDVKQYKCDCFVRAAVSRAARMTKVAGQFVNENRRAISGRDSFAA
jgi:hypothetical protein